VEYPLQGKLSGNSGKRIIKVYLGLEVREVVGIDKRWHSNITDVHSFGALSY